MARNFWKRTDVPDFVLFDNVKYIKAKYNVTGKQSMVAEMWGFEVPAPANLFELGIKKGTMTNEIPLVIPVDGIAYIPDTEYNRKKLEFLTKPRKVKVKKRTYEDGEYKEVMTDVEKQPTFTILPDETGTPQSETNELKAQLAAQQKQIEALMEQNKPKGKKTTTKAKSKDKPEPVFEK